MSAVLGQLNSWSFSVGSIEVVAKQTQAREKLWTDKGGGWTVSKVSQVAGEYVFTFLDHATAYVSMASKKILISSIDPDISAEALEHLALDQILPRALAHEEYLVLHASAVTKKGCTITIVGPSGYGKSTMAGSFLEAGWSLLGDDAFVISEVGGRFMGRAIYQSLRLKPDSVEKLFMDQHSLSQLFPYTSKQRITVQQEADSYTGPVTVPAIFFLAPEHSKNAINVRQMSAAETCIGIITNSFSLDPTDAALAANKLTIAGAMAADIPAFELSYPRDFSRLHDVHVAIQNQLEHLNGSANASTIE